VFELRLSHKKELMEHGFVKALYKRCRLNAKKLEDADHIETKKQSGAKVTEA
jgi:hypothetical protein